LYFRSKSDYLRAHLQYQLVENEKLAEEFGDATELLKTALVSHKYALSIDENNAEALFNTAQVLSSFAEALFEEDEDKNERECIKMLQEAIELLSACLSKQEHEFEENQSTQGGPTTDDGDVAMEDSPVPERPQTDWEWVRVQEPTTASTLIETATTQLHVLAQYAGCLAADPAAHHRDHYSSALANLSSLAGRLLDEKLPAYLAQLARNPPPPDGPDADPAFLDLGGTFHAAPSPASPPAGADAVWRATRDVDLARAGFACALADAELRGGLADAAGSARAVAAAFAFHDPLGAPGAVGARDLPALTDHAQALRALADGALAPLLEGGEGAPGEGLRAAWEALGTADRLMDRAVQAAKGSSLAAPARAAILVRAYVFRGDAALLRRRVALLGEGREREHAGLLLKNAGVYYRGADRSVGEAVANDAEVLGLVWDARARERVVQVLEGGRPEGAFAAGEDVLRRVVEEMGEEGLLAGEETEMVARALL
jgi:hypothetical protein